MQRLPRLVTPVLVVCLCALVGWWITRLMPGASLPIPPTAAIDGGAAGGRADAVLASARLFGSRPPGVLSDNVRALGVVADASGRGSVIVSVDGQAAKVYRVGDTLDGRLVSAIRPDAIELDAGGARQIFRLPPPRASAPGLTIVGIAGNGAAVAVPSTPTDPQNDTSGSRVQAPTQPMLVQPEGQPPQSQQPYGPAPGFQGPLPMPRRGPPPAGSPQGLSQ